LVNRSRNAFFLLAGIGGVSSAQVQIYFVYSLAWKGFGKHILRYILCPRWNGRHLVKTCRDALCVLTGMEWIWSTHVDIDFVPSLAWEVFGHQKLKYILCPPLAWNVLG
jgi:hypothetical protein